MIDAYAAWKFVHLTGVVMLMGNITVTAIWKFFADRDGRPAVLAFAQKLVTYTDWSMTVWGVVLTMAGGYALAVLGGYPLTTPWLLWSQGLFVTSGLIWLLAIVPIQVRQARAARAFTECGDIPATYEADSRAWLRWGLLSTVPLLGAMALMILRP